MSTYFRNDLLPYPCLYLAIFSPNILGEHLLLKQPFSLGFCDYVVLYWDVDNLSQMPSSLDWISGAFHMHDDFFFDLRLCSFVSFFERHRQHGYFWLPCHLINAECWNIRREQTSTERSGWIHQIPLPLFSLSLISVMSIIVIFQGNSWGRILYICINHTNITLFGVLAIILKYS